MRVPSNLKPRAGTLNLTPMIDVVFNLIIFFIVSSTLVQQEVSMELELPAAETGQAMKESASRKLILNIPSPGQILVGSQPIDLDRLRHHLVSEKLVAEKQHAGKELEVRIRTSKNVSFGEVEPILVLCAENGIWNVSFSVEQKSPE